MKKFLALTLVMVLAAALCIGVSAETELMNKAWDAIYVDGKLVSPITGGADVWIDSNEIKGSMNKISVSGWAFISTNITGFAYTIDDGEPVKSADFIKDRNDVHQYVHEIAEGFEITIDVSSVGKGAHTIKLFAIDENGELVDTTYVLPFTQEKEAEQTPETTPPTSDAAVIATAAVACIALAGVIISKKVNLWKKYIFNKRAVILTVIITVVSALILFPGDKLLFGPFSSWVNDQYTISPTIPKIIGGLLVGGIIEEVMMRLFLMSLLALIFSKIFCKKRE